MKNLTHLSLPPAYIHYYQQIVEGKNETYRGQPNAKKRRLKALEAGVLLNYGSYSESYAADGLAGMVPHGYEGDDKAALIDAYESGGAALDGLKTFIKAAQPESLQGVCQYCGILPPRTMDHYLPKEDFPEFAVLALNLVPCCGECNGYKHQYWREDGKRAILNFYLDQVIAERFLYVSVTYARGTIIPRFTVENRLHIDAEQFSKIERHFSRLRLLSRYKEQSNDFITDIIDAVVSNTDETNEDILRENLRRRARKFEMRLGVNSWKAVLAYELANCVLFLEQLKGYIRERDVA